MAVTSIPASTSLILEVRKGTNENGEATFTHKSFYGLKDNVDVQKVYDTSIAISKVLAEETRNIYIASKNSLINE